MPPSVMFSSSLSFAFKASFARSSADRAMRPSASILHVARFSSVLSVDGLGGLEGLIKSLPPSITNANSSPALHPSSVLVAFGKTIRPNKSKHLDLLGYPNKIKTPTLK